MTPTVFVVVTCMGRRSFLEHTVPAVLAQPDVRYCLVDYSCPDKSGDWMERKYASERAKGRIVVERIAGQVRFNKCKALNAGARRAIAEGAEYLCFLDADTVVEPGFFYWLSRRLESGRFLIAALDEEGYDPPSLTGVLVVASRDFASTDGFDESFQGWGAEDVEMRLRLHMLHGLGYRDIPLSLVSALPHDDALRTGFYDEKNKDKSERANTERMMHKAQSWLGVRPTDLANAKRLTFQVRPPPAAPDQSKEAREAMSFGQMYAAVGRYAEAELAYEQRMELGGWDEAVWYSIFQVALLGLKLGRPWVEVESKLLKAHAYRPTRAEPLWVLAVCCRQRGEHARAYAYSRQAAALAEPDDVLGVQRDVYQWRAHEEVALSAMHLGEMLEARRAFRELLTRPGLPASEHNRIRTNEAYCQQQLAMAAADDAQCDHPLAGADAEQADHAVGRTEGWAC